MIRLGFVAVNATTKLIQRGILLYTKVQYIKESNTLAANATIKQLQREVLLNIKGEYMKESNTLVDSAENN